MAPEARRIIARSRGTAGQVSAGNMLGGFRGGIGTTEGRTGRGSRRWAVEGRKESEWHLHERRRSCRHRRGALESGTAHKRDTNLARTPSVVRRTLAGCVGVEKGERLKSLGPR